MKTREIGMLEEERDRERVQSRLPPPPSTESGLEFSIPQDDDDDVLPAMVVGRRRSTAIMAPLHCYIIQEEREERGRGAEGSLAAI